MIIDQRKKGVSKLPVTDTATTSTSEVTVKW